MVANRSGVFPARYEVAFRNALALEIAFRHTVVILAALGCAAVRDAKYNFVTSRGRERAEGKRQVR
mgnify:CR=1 FL=1